MSKATFETPEGEDVEIESDEVVQLATGEEPETTVIELENGVEVVVVATQLEVAAELGLNPLDYVDVEEDDDSIESLIEDSDEAEE